VTGPQRIGLFGGTFDPVHYGHLRPALELTERYVLDTLYLLPNHKPAHRSAPGASTVQRIEMLSLAVDGVSRLSIDSREANRDKPSYTVDTLAEVRNEHPDATLLFFMGLDAFSNFTQWHRWQEILILANLVVIDRPNVDLSQFSADLLRSQAELFGEQIVDGSTGVIERCPVTQLSISATAIRACVNAGHSIRFLLPDEVREYIEQQRLYC
jgi:nicotinate-nucleotide adenylyltransferase